MKRNRFIVNKFGTEVGLGTEITKLKEGETPFASLEKAYSACLARNPEAKRVDAVIIYNKRAKRNEYFFSLKGPVEKQGKKIELVIIPAWETESKYRSVFGRMSYLINED